MSRRLALAVAALFAAWGIRCAWRGHHDPVRHVLGGQVCRTCGKPGADRDELGEDATLSRARNFSREHGGSYMRGARWAPPDERARKGGL